MEKKTEKQNKRKVKFRKVVKSNISWRALFLSLMTVNLVGFIFGLAFNQLILISLLVFPISSIIAGIIIYFDEREISWEKLQ